MRFVQNGGRSLMLWLTVSSTATTTTTYTYAHTHSRRHSSQTLTTTTNVCASCARTQNSSAARCCWYKNHVCATRTMRRCDVSATLTRCWLAASSDSTSTTDVRAVLPLRCADAFAVLMFVTRDAVFVLVGVFTCVHTRDCVDSERTSDLLLCE